MSNKINEVDLSPELLAKLFSHGSSVDLSSILADYLKKSDNIDASKLPQSYLDGVKNDIANLSSKINEYRRNDVAIDYNALSANLQNQIKTIQQKIDAINAYYKDTSKKILTLQGNIQGMQSMEDQLQKAVNSISTTYDSQISNLNNKVENNTAYLNTEAQTIASKYRNKNKKIKYDDLDTVLKAKIDTASDDGGSGISSGSLNINGNLGENLIIADNGQIATSTPVIFAKIGTYTDDDRTNQNLVYDYDNDLLYEEGGKITKKASENVSYLANHLIYDDVNRKMYYLYVEDGNRDIYTVSNLGLNSYFVKVTINGNASLTFNNVNISNKVEVRALDNDRGIINSEGIVTVGYKNNNMTIYNDNDSPIMVIISYESVLPLISMSVTDIKQIM